MYPDGTYYYSTNPPPLAPHQPPPPFFAPNPAPHRFFPTASVAAQPPPAYPHPYPYHSGFAHSFGLPAQAYPSPFGCLQPHRQSPPPPVSTLALPPRPLPPRALSSASSRAIPNSAPSSSTPDRHVSPPCAEQLRDQQLFRMSTDEYGEVLRDLGRLTVDKLKTAIKNLNALLGTYIRTNGLKADIYTRLRGEIDRIYTYDRARFPLVKTTIHNAYLGYTSNPQPLAGSNYTSGSGAATAAATSSAHANYGSTTSNYGASGSSYGATNSAYGGRPLGGSAAAATATGASRFGAGGSTTSAGGYGASYGAGLGPGAGGAAGAAINRWQNDDVPIKFRPSPFYRVEKSLSPPVTLWKADPGDRKVGSISFGLTEPQRALITKARESPNNPQYEVRLYCTSDNNYSIGRPHASQFPAPIEFPQTSEIKLNGVTVNVNTKGIKKQPGTTPPVNLSSKKGPTVLTGAGQLNKVELIYTNTERITYYMVAYLVESTPIKKVVEKVKAGRTKPKEEVVQSIKDLNSDEEIAAGPLGLSLRDPLSFARIGTPVRSKMCNHISCFDAETWFEMNEQTPTWNCPICSKTLKFEDMVVDGYFEDILKVCPSSVDSVTVNPDGTWRSDDNKHGTGPVRVEKVNGTATNDTSRRSSPSFREREESTKPDISHNTNGNGNGKGKAKQVEALTLDSDSDDEPLAKRPRLGGALGGLVGGGGGGGGSSHSGSPFGGGAGTNGLRNGRGASEVLDLTLSDSDDDGPPPPRPVPVARPSNLSAMARTSSGGGMKTVADVQRDIDAMQQRMREEYGEDWRTRFDV